MMDESIDLQSIIYDLSDLVSLSKDIKSEIETMIIGFMTNLKNIIKINKNMNPNYEPCICYDAINHSFQISNQQNQVEKDTIIANSVLIYNAISVFDSGVKDNNYQIILSSIDILIRKINTFMNGV